MKKRFLSWPLILIMVCVAVVMSAFTEAPTGLNRTGVTQSPAAVVAASYQAMDAGMNAGNVVRHPGLAQLSGAQVLSSAQANTSSSVSGAFLYQYDQSRVSVFRNWAALHTHDYSSIQARSTFQVKSTQVQGVTAQVIGDETFHIDATVQDNGQLHTFSPAKSAFMASIKNTSEYIGVGQTNHAVAIVHHTVSLSQVNNSWVIESDNYWDPLAQALTADHHSVMSAQPISNAPAKKQSSAHPASSYSYTYARQTAIQYADAYWDSCNPGYSCYISQDVDCANFVSQAIYDGNGGNLPGDNYWYAGSVDFINAPGLYNYLTNSPDGSTYNYASSAVHSYNYSTAASQDLYDEYPGDLIFYDWGNVFGYGAADGVIDHTAISVGADSNGYNYEDAHTTNLYHYYWDLGGGTSTGYYFVMLKDSGTALG